MSSIELSEILSAAAAPLQIVTTGLVAVQSRSIRRMEKQLATLAGHRHPAAHCKPPMGPLALLCLIVLTAGCSSLPGGMKFSVGYTFPATVGIGIDFPPRPGDTNTTEKVLAPTAEVR